MILVKFAGRWCEITLAQAVADTCASSVESAGVVEDAQNTADNVAKLLGKTLELLVQKGVLAEAEIVALFLDDYNYKVEP